MSVSVLLMMPFIVLILGIVVSLIVVGGIADANLQAQQLESNREDQEGLDAPNLEKGERRTLPVDNRRKVS